MWVEVLRRSTQSAARDSRSTPEASAKGRSFVGVSWARAATRIQSSAATRIQSSPPSPKEDAAVVVKKLPSPSINRAIRPYASPSEEKDVRSPKDSPPPNAGTTVNSMSSNEGTAVSLITSNLVEIPSLDASPLVARVESVSVIASVGAPRASVAATTDM